MQVGPSLSRLTDQMTNTTTVVGCAAKFYKGSYVSTAPFVIGVQPPCGCSTTILVLQKFLPYPIQHCGSIYFLLVSRIERRIDWKRLIGYC